MDRNEAIKVVKDNWPESRHQLKEALQTLIPELQESNDERIIDNAIKIIRYSMDGVEVGLPPLSIHKECIAWLEKQGELIDKLVKYREWLVSKTEQWTNRENDKTNSNAGKHCCIGAANALISARAEFEEIFDYESWFEKQGEQDPIDNVEPKFKVGDWVQIDGGHVMKILDVKKDVLCYRILNWCGNESVRNISDIDSIAHLWTIKDAKDGDVLVIEEDASSVECIFIFKSVAARKILEYCYLRSNNTFSSTVSFISYVDDNYHPSTKEQRDLLFSKMKEAGYEWDAEKKELRKIAPVQSELPNGEDYDIDSLYHAARILEKTLGEVEGYQSDDGILEHKCAIEAVNRLYKQKPAWSEEDEKIFDSIMEDIMPYGECPDYPTDKEREYFYEGNRKVEWLKSIKERMKGE